MAELEYGEVRGQYLLEQSNVTRPAAGTVVFTPIEPRGRVDVEEMALTVREAVEATFDGDGWVHGAGSQVDYLTLAEGRWEVSFRDAPGLKALKAYQFDVTAGEEVNLPAVAPLVPTPSEKFVVNEFVYTQTLGARDEALAFRNEAEQFAEDAQAPTNEVVDERIATKRGAVNGVGSLTSGGRQPDSEVNANLTPQALSSTIGAAVPDAAAEAMGNPESALQAQTIALIEANAVPPANAPYDYFIGATTGAARPVWSGPVRWLTTVETKPTHIRTSPPSGIGPDTWAFVTPDPLPDVLVWSDSFTRADGAVGNTEVGGLPYIVAGAGGWVISGNKLAPTTGSGAGYLVVENGSARTLQEVVIDTQVTGYGAWAGAFTDASNRLVLARVSSSSLVYRLVKTLGGTTTEVRATTVPMETGDRIRWDARQAGKLKISVFKGSVETVLFDETVHTAQSVSEFVNVTKSAFYNGSMAATGVRFDTASVYRVA